MKTKLLGFFLMLGLFAVTPSVVLSIAVEDEPFEGQDYSEDFLIGEMDEQYTDDEKYLQEDEDYPMSEEEPHAPGEYQEEELDEDTQDEDAKDEEIFE
jgi:hypothetical protein